MPKEEEFQKSAQKI